MNTLIKIATNYVLYKFENTGYQIADSFQQSQMDLLESSQCPRG